jgi:Flp pilus assembly protein TadD
MFPKFPKSTRIPSLTILSAVVLAACSREAAQPKTPLAQAQPAAATQAVADPLPSAARSALDQGNASYRAGRFQAALDSYRAAAKAAPSEAAPYFGVLMVAQKLGNKALADSASQAIAARNGDGQMLTDSSMRALHAAGQAK